MVRHTFIFRLILMTTMLAQRYINLALGATRADASENSFGPPVPSEVEYVPYRGSVPNLKLSAKRFVTAPGSEADCKSMAYAEGADFWNFSEGNCSLGSLSAPVCKEKSGPQTDYFILEEDLTDGRDPNEESFASEEEIAKYTFGQPHMSFRVLKPTITQIPEFMTEIGGNIKKIDTDEKVFVLPKPGGIEAFDDNILLDLSCLSRNPCGVPFVTTSVDKYNELQLDLETLCGKTIRLSETPVLNILSHIGVGCKPFPEFYPENCELNITSTGHITVNVILTNLRTTFCKSTKLIFIAYNGGEASNEVDVCKEDAPTDFTSSEGKIQIKIPGGSISDKTSYGFIARFERPLRDNEIFQCHTGNSVQDVSETAHTATDGQTLGPTDAFAQSPIPGTTQGFTDNPTQTLTENPSESLTNGPGQNSAQGSSPTPVDIITQTSIEGYTTGLTQCHQKGTHIHLSSPKSHHLKFMLKLGFNLITIR